MPMLPKVIGNTLLNITSGKTLYIKYICADINELSTKKQVKIDRPNTLKEIINDLKNINGFISRSLDTLLNNILNNLYLSTFMLELFINLGNMGNNMMPKTANKDTTNP